MELWAGLLQHLSPPSSRATRCGNWENSSCPHVGAAHSFRQEMFYTSLPGFMWAVDTFYGTSCLVFLCPLCSLPFGMHLVLVTWGSADPTHPGEVLSATGTSLHPQPYHEGSFGHHLFPFISQPTRLGGKNMFDHIFSWGRELMQFPCCPSDALLGLPKNRDQAN